MEKFFEAVKPHMRPQDYKVFVEKSHRRFHPDRWRGRSLLRSVIDEAERGCMEVGKLFILAKALTSELNYSMHSRKYGGSSPYTDLARADGTMILSSSSCGWDWND